MNKSLDEVRSQELAQHVKSKARTPFENAHRGALAIAGAVYVQGFLVVADQRCKVLEHAWLEHENSIIDPSFPHFDRPADAFHYFAAHRITLKQLKAAIEEAKEDYPEDEPLPIYGAAPYEYYGDVMLGDREYQKAYEAAQSKCQELRQTKS